MKTLPEVLGPSDRISTIEEIVQAIDLINGIGSSQIEGPDQELCPPMDVGQILPMRSANLWIDAARTEKFSGEAEPLAGIFVRKHGPTN